MKRSRLYCLAVAAILILPTPVYGAQSSGITEQVYVDSDSTTPAFIAGSLTPSSPGDAQEIVHAYLGEKEKLYGLAEGESAQFQTVSETTDELGLVNVKLQQLFNGIPVFGSIISAHVDSNGVLKSVSGELVPNLMEVPGLTETAALDSGQASAAAIESLEKFYGRAMEMAPAEKPELVIYLDKEVPVLAYHIRYEFLSPAPGNYHYFVDAQTGAILEYYNQIHGAAPEGNDSLTDGIGVLGDRKKVNTVLNSAGSYLTDRTRGKGIFTYDAANGTEIPGTLWLDVDHQLDALFDGAAVDAHYYAGLTFDYFKTVHGRNSYDGQGAAIVSTVHYGKDYNNAFWSGSQMVYGDGDGKKFLPLSGSLDVIAHELTHALTESTAGLIYWNDAGAINESMSDIFGVLIEHAYSKTPDWQIGEDVYTPEVSGDALRSLADPTLNGLPDHYTKRYLGLEDFGGVHINSSISNKAAYLLANGGTHFNVKVEGIGIEKTGKIFYRTLTQYLTPTTKFRQLQAASVQAATDLYGVDSQEVKSVKAAFAAVGLK
ncbi:peptidase M4 family protein [Planomicrobium chinense]|uniref:M4 family metallopeptidase n=1 Tax=Planococcus chinensis TaxID=272917 RepID=UPI001CC74533|nr:M4 family metallopeptidase [Planococcus chinensis]MBZ5202593.1 peptidase M4 family protein [Planococcus chinensis]